MAEAKLVTEKQVKEVCKEYLDDRIPDQVKPLDERINGLKMDLLDFQGDVRNDYAKQERVRDMVEGLEKRLTNRID
jgi:hypothetical protein